MTQSIVVTTNGSYTVQITDVNGCTATSAPTAVTVNALPATPTITPDGPTTFCAGGSVQLTSSVANAYLWSNSEMTQSIVVTTNGSYTVQITDVNGCTATSAPTAVTVNALPATPTITPDGPTTFCAGGSVQLTSSAADAYLWSNSEMTQSIEVTTNGSYTVQITDVNGCTATSAPTAVTMNARLPRRRSRPTARQRSAPAAAAVDKFGSGCLSVEQFRDDAKHYGDDKWFVHGSDNGRQRLHGHISADSSNGERPAHADDHARRPDDVLRRRQRAALTSPAADAYLWSNSEMTQSIVVTTNGSYTVQITDVNGCTATSAPTAVTVNALPVANAGSGTDECDLELTLAAVPSVGTGTWTYTGPGTAMFAPDANDPAAVATVTAFGVYMFTWTEVNGACTDDETVSVNFNAPPAVTLNDPADVCLTGADMNFTGTPTDANGSFTTTAGAGFTDNGNGTAVLDVSAAGIGTYDDIYLYRRQRMYGIANGERIGYLLRTQLHRPCHLGSRSPDHHDWC
ncbi:MAG: hypothetical protein IPK76_21265 [Lewinellaceae bacterium]|nr:hypothetical protein [Lewinellaceae bacterium]